ncbi:MAG: efflux RND transporter permease subunit [Candidatus Magnetoovum sp. WYHC-5]|nr:efflux RND transporter permease subunit [Candidatus Magnetoovum sp. WYHC-5]
MKPLIKFTISHTVLLNIVYVLLIISGVFCLLTTPVENMPPVDLAKVFINTVYFGASADDVESLVTEKIENALDGIENIEFVKSTSRRNTSSVEVKFIDDTDYRTLYNEVRFKILNIKSDLPLEVDEPDFNYLDTQSWVPVIVVNLVGDVSNMTLKLLADELKSDIININNVKEVEISGEYKKEFHVSLDPEKLRRYGITFDQAANSIKSANTKIPTGRFKEQSTEFMLDTGKRFAAQEDILNTIVRLDGDGNFIRVRDISTIARLSYRAPELISSVNGQSTIKLIVKKENSGNSIDIAREVKETSKRFEEIHKKDGISLIFTNDSTIEINDSIDTLTGDLIMGTILVTMSLWVTMGFTNAILASIGVPFAYLAAIIFIKFTGNSINTISLFSFVLVSGILVDDAIVVIENVYRHMQMGKNKQDAVIDGVSEVFSPVISAILTNILAFIPMLLMSGTTGEFFSIIPMAVSYTLIASLFETLFALPIHILDFAPMSIKKNANPDTEAHLKSGFFAILWKVYSVLLNFTLKRQWLTLSSIFLIFIISITILVLSISGMVPLIKMEFFPGSYFRYHVPIEMPTGTSTEETDSVVRDISRFIMSFGAKQAQAASGISGMYDTEDYVIRFAHHYGQIVVTLPEEKDVEFPENPTNNYDLHLDFIRKKLNEYIGAHYKNKLKPKVRVFAEKTGPPAGKPVNIRLTGQTVEDVTVAADAIKEFLYKEKELSDLIEIEDDRANIQRVIKFTTKEEKAHEYNLPPSYVNSVVASMLNGQPAGKYRVFDEEVELLVRIARKDDNGNHTGIGISSPSEILDIPIIEHSQSPVYLREVVNVKYVNEPDSRNHYMGKPAISITADIKAGSLLSPSRVQVLVKNHFETIKEQFHGVTVNFAGEFESTSRAYTSLTFAFLISILGIYMVLAGQFRDYFQPLIILSSVAFALIGVVMGMFITQSVFTIGSFMAIVGLAGVAVNDSIIIIDFMNTQKSNGIPLRETIIYVCKTRMRPIFLTSVTTILGLLPMAIGIPTKSISWSPMATAFVTGLFSSTTLTFLIVPVEYEILERFRQMRKKIFKETAL